MLKCLTKKQTKRRDATILTEADMIKMKDLYHNEGIKTDELCRIFRCGKRRVISLLNGDNSALGGYTHRKKGSVCTGGANDREAPMDSDMLMILNEVMADNDILKRKKQKRMEQEQKGMLDNITACTLSPSVHL